MPKFTDGPTRKLRDLTKVGSSRVSGSTNIREMIKA